MGSISNPLWLVYQGKCAKTGTDYLMDYFPPDGGAVKSGTTLLLTAGEVYYQPFLILQTTTVTSIKFEVTGASGAGTGVYCGIYYADEDWQPTTLLVKGNAEIATDAIGVKTATLTASTNIARGRYVMAMAVEDAPTMRAVNGANIGFNTTLGASCMISYLRVTKAYADLATTGTAWDDAPMLPNGFYRFMWLNVTDVA